MPPKKKTSKKKKKSVKEKAITKKKSSSKAKARLKANTTAKGKKKVTTKKKVKAKAKKKVVSKKKAPTAKAKKAVKKSVSKKATKKATSKNVAKATKAKVKKSKAKKVPKKPQEEEIETPPVPKITGPVLADPQLQKIKDILVQSRSRLLKMLQSSREVEQNVDDITFSNEIDLASSLEGREMAFQLSSRERNELKMVEEALLRIDKGSYGICETCSKRIGLKRLQIMPLTPLCIECQSNLEVS